ncbi:MAG: F0F1 ATP synthase subunit epsilon [Herpetosiphonaceae bacterium]|nr:F0F1 ATP synthase subunit epsilon [Herpetosiphonaceae bacterium]
MPIHLEIVTAERTVLSDDVDQVNAPGAAGRVGILPRHEPLLTALLPGELSIVKHGERTPFAISGGFMEVLPDRITILADSVERADEIDENRAEAARRRAEEAMRNRTSAQELATTEMQLRRAVVRLQVARLRKGDRGMQRGRED